MGLDLAKIRQFENLEFLAKQAVEGFITGLHKSPYHGFSVEFAEHKSYNIGESTRHIDWKVFARTDKLFTKRYEEETNLRCHILLDNSSSMYFPEPEMGKITFSIFAAAALTVLLQKQRDAVGITTFSDEVEHTTEIKSTGGHIHTLLQYLNSLKATVQKNKSSNVTEAIHLIAEKAGRRSLIIIFSDMFDSSGDNTELFKALLHLKHNKHEVLVFHVFDGAHELDLDYEDRPYTFVDAENANKVKLTPEEIKKEYTQKMSVFYNELKHKCGQYKIDFVQADITKDIDQILMSYLMKRARI